MGWKGNGKTGIAFDIFYNCSYNKVGKFPEPYSFILFNQSISLLITIIHTVKSTLNK